MLRILTAIGIGLGLGGLIASFVGPPGAAAWAIPVGLTLTILSGTFVLIARSAGRISLPSPILVQSARNADRVGVARIDALTQTGTLINDQPVCDLELTVQPLHGEAFRTKLRMIVKLVEIPNVQPGTRNVVAVLADGQPDIALLPDDPFSGRFAGITVPPASDAGSLLVAAPGALRGNGSRSKPLLSVGHNTRPLRIALYVASAIVAAAVIVLPYRVGFAQTVTALSQGQLHADLRQAAYLPDAIDTLVREVGHDSVVDVLVTPEYVYYTAPVSAGSRETDVWIYRGGVVTHEGPASIQPDSADEQFAVGDVDWRAIWPGLEAAARLVDTDDLSDTSITVQRTNETNVESDRYMEQVGQVQVGLAINSPYQDHWFTMAADGSDVQLSGSN